jgi:hypothetical protein
MSKCTYKTSNPECIKRKPIGADQFIEHQQEILSLHVVAVDCVMHRTAL